MRDDIRDLLSISNHVVLFSQRIVIPTNLQRRFIEQLHQGHPGMSRMKNLARNLVYWPNIDFQIEQFVKSCSKCAIHGKSPIKTDLQSWPLPNKPWERLHIDYAGPFKNYYFLIVVDALSKWPEVVKTSSTTSTKTINILESIFATFGYPETLVSDNGTQFTSDEFRKYCEFYQINHIRSSPYHPSSNGQAERFVDTFKRSINKLEGEGSLDENIITYLRTYRPTPNTESNKSPSEILFNRKIRNIFSFIQPKTYSTPQHNSKMEQQYNLKHGTTQRSFQINDKIYVQIHKQNTWTWEEGCIAKRIGEVNCLVTTKDKSIIAHTDQIKRREDITY